MRTVKRTRHLVLFLLLAFLLMCSLGALAQGPDQLLTNNQATTNNSTRNNATVDCAQTDGSGNCTAGQYFHSDGAQWYGTWNSTFVTTSPRKYGAYKAYASGDTPANNTPSSPCWGCHHGNATNGYINGDTVGSSLGANYMTGGHKNMLRKVVPSHAPYNTQGVAQYSDTSFLDLAGNLYDWTNATITLSGGATKPLYYLFGWTDEPDILYQGGGSTSNYNCARCHTTGYRFDGGAPEPTSLVWDAGSSQYVPGPKLSDTDLKRYPASGAAGDTSSWFLTGIQCERCHQADMQFDPAQYNPNYNASGTLTPTQGRISHLVNVAGGSAMPPSFWIDPNVVSPSTTRPLPVIPVNERSTALCVQCHRTEITKGGAGVTGNIHPAQLPGFENSIAGATNLSAFKDSGKCSDGSAKGYSVCIAANLKWNFSPNMSHGANGAQAFLNSPHARYIGTFDLTTQNSTDMSLGFPGTYNSFFTDWGEAPGSKTAGVANSKNGGCVGCHDIHNTLVKVNATNVGKSMAKECTDCHQNGSRYAVANVAHSTGAGTPFPDGFGSSEGCITCHMVAAPTGSPSYHYFRINPSASYYTFGPAAVYYAGGDAKSNQQPNTYVEAGFGPNGPYNYNAVGVDVDLACGQCHTGGNGAQNTYSLKSPGAPAFTRAALSTFATGMHNTVPKTAVNPTVTPGTGTYVYSGSGISVTLSDATAHAQICYTTDGSTPAWQDLTPSAEEATMACTGTGTLVGSGTVINVSQNATVKAIAGGTNSIGNVLTPSAVVTATYSVKAPAPTFSLGTGMYSAQQTVSLTAAVGTINYCTVAMGGTCTPASVYSGPINVSVPTTIIANAGGAGYVSSSNAQASYNIVPATPTFSPAGGRYQGAQTVTVSGPAGTTIYYTINGSVPSTTNYAGTVAAGGTVTVPKSEYLRAIAVYTSGTQTAKSSVATAVYTIY